MEYKSFLRINIHKQFIRTYLFIAVISIILLITLLLADALPSE